MSKDKKDKVCTKCGQVTKSPCITWVGAHLFCDKLKNR